MHKDILCVYVCAMQTKHLFLSLLEAFCFKRSRISDCSCYISFYSSSAIFFLFCFGLSFWFPSFLFYFKKQYLCVVGFVVCGVLRENMLFVQRNKRKSYQIVLCVNLFIQSESKWFYVLLGPFSVFIFRSWHFFTTRGRAAS